MRAYTPFRDDDADGTDGRGAPPADLADAWIYDEREAASSASPEIPLTVSGSRATCAAAGPLQGEMLPMQLEAEASVTRTTAQRSAHKVRVAVVDDERSSRHHALAARVNTRQLGLRPVQHAATQSRWSRGYAAAAALLLLASAIVFAVAASDARSTTPVDSPCPPPPFDEVAALPPLPSPPAPLNPPWERFWWQPSPPPTPLPPPPSPPMHVQIQQRVARINARFWAGEPSNNASRAGVLLHTFDGGDTGRLDVWNPCPAGTWCHPVSDRISASLINSHLRSFFWAGNEDSGIADAMGGFVIDAEALQPQASSLLCAWSSDAGSMNSICHPLGVRNDPAASCVPGCSGTPCRESASAFDYCWWPPHQLQEMVSRHQARPKSHGQGCGQHDCNCASSDRGGGGGKGGFQRRLTQRVTACLKACPCCVVADNELIFDAARWSDRLPDAVAAIFFPATSAIGEERARAVRSAFAAAFDLPTGLPPLVRYSMDSADRRNGPFEMVST